MAKREPNRQQITCPVCKQKGLIELSELENPVFSHGQLDTRAENILSGNFKLTHGKLTCECGEPVSIG